MSISPNERMEQAKQEATEKDVDRIVRVIAFSGEISGPNGYRHFDGLLFEATDGAGTNSARVRIYDDSKRSMQYLYRADDYGRVLQVFRTGPWVKRAVLEAAKEEAALEAARKDRDMRAAEEKAANFLPCDY